MSTPPSRPTTVGGPEARAARRRARKDWPIRRFALGEEPSDDLSSITGAAERFAMVWPLTLLSWQLSERSIPVYERSEMPGNVIRASEEP